MTDLPRPVVETKTKLGGARVEYDCELLSLRDGYAMVRHVLDREVRLSNGLLPEGTVTFGHYWEDRMYNIYCWNGPDGRHLGDYINISDQTQLSESGIFYRDLVVDVLVWQDSEPLVLDEDELPPDLSDELAARIGATLELVRTNYERILSEIHPPDRPS
jgi:hypothetical protein